MRGRDRSRPPFRSGAAVTERVFRRLRPNGAAAGAVTERNTVIRVIPGLGAGQRPFATRTGRCLVWFEHQVVHCRTLYRPDLPYYGAGSREVFLRLFAVTAP